MNSGESVDETRWILRGFGFLESMGKLAIAWIGSSRYNYRGLGFGQFCLGLSIGHWVKMGFEVC